MRIEISRRIFPVKRKQILATLVAAVTLLGAVALLLTSCGTSDKVASVSISAAGTTGTVNLAGLGGTLQLQVLANYTSGKQVDETNWSTYTVTPQGTLDDGVTPLPIPPYGVSVSSTGMVTATQADANGGGICTWVNVGSSATPAWAFTGDYEIMATYKGMQSQPIYIPVASAAGPASASGECGPSSSQ